MAAPIDMGLPMAQYAGAGAVEGAIWVARAKSSVRIRAAKGPLGSRCSVQIGPFGGGECEVFGPAEVAVTSSVWVQPLDRGWARAEGWETPPVRRGSATMSG